jgi:ABC-type Na+ efflux pump permease subunit
MNVARVALAVAGKELRTGFRDRQAMIYAIVLPLALYPVLFWVMLQGALVVEGERERTEVTAALAGARDPAEAGALADALRTPPAGEPPGPVAVRDADAADLGALRAGRLDAVVALEGANLGPELAQLRPERGGAIFYDGSKSRSSLARRRAAERLEHHAREARLAAVGGDPAALEAFRVEEESLATGVEESAFILSFLLPMMFCIMAVLGAFFPAVDLGAGEKERGTAETTLLLPVPRIGVLAGKILTVAAFALIATVLNVAGLLVAAEHLLSGMGESFAFEVPWSAFPRAAPLLLLFLVTTSALLFAVASFADTFKQGQSLLGPVQMVVLVPAILVSMPGIELTPALALVPVAQTALAFKAVLQGDAGTLELGLVAASETIYAVLAVLVALKLTASEARALGGGSRRRGLLGGLLGRLAGKGSRA